MRSFPSLLPFVLFASACGPAARGPEPLPPGSVYVDSGPVTGQGPLDVSRRELREGELGAPRPVTVYAPSSPGTYPLVLFQHGFLSDAHAYSVLLTTVASHGFVVVAPQMYPPDGVPLGKPLAADEAHAAAAVARWAAGSAGAVLGVATDRRAPGVSGHSRGGKVAWLLARQEHLPMRALAGVDPVDGRGSFLLSAQPEALPAAGADEPPSVIVGMARGGSCAPEGDNYRHFFERTAPPVTLAVVAGHGHADMLDPGIDLGGLCFQGPNPDAVRAFVAASLVAHFRATLQDDPGAAAFLSSPALAPLELTREAR